MNKKGFTLIELIVYIAISSMTLVVALNIGWNLIRSDADSNTKTEVYYNARLVSNQLQLKIREAEDLIVGSSTFGSANDVLVLDYPGPDTDVIFDTYTKNITIGGQSIAINKLRIKEGTADYVDLTTDKVSVTNFTLRNLTRGIERPNIKIDLTIENANPTGDPTYDESISIKTALSIRE